MKRALYGPAAFGDALTFTSNGVAVLLTDGFAASGRVTNSIIADCGGGACVKAIN